MFAAIKGFAQSFIPRVGIDKTADGHTRINGRWTDTEGFNTDRSVQFKYVCNSERLACERGDAMPDGSLRYIDPLSGMVHTMSAERVAAFTKETVERMNRVRSMHDAFQRAQNAGDQTVDVVPTAG